MKYYEDEIKNCEDRIKVFKTAQALIDERGLLEKHPAICISTKQIILLGHQIDSKYVKNKEGIETLEIKIAGYVEKSSGHWYNINDLVPYTDASRVLYLT